MILFFVGQCLWHILPAYVANMVPLFAAMLLGDRWATPLDFHRTWNGHPILGRNKTYRGFIAGVLAAIAVSYVQLRLCNFPTIRPLSLLFSGDVNFVWWGFLMGFGALFGDAVKSFLKRRRQIPPGESWRPFDQIDFLLGALAFTSLAFVPPFSLTLGILAIMPWVKVLVAHFGFWIGLRKSKW